jgi:phosphoribosyl 1,2-cyclic phosphodiesterase
MKVRFWGVRGSLPTPGRGTVRYGGNTSCVEVRLDERRLIFDAGSGLVSLATAMLAEPGPIDVDLLLSHTHFDHICGLPFFAPLFRPENKIRIWSGRLDHGVAAKTALHASLNAPFNPDLGASIRASIEFREFAAGSVLDLGGGVTARTTMLPHPGGSIAYRVEWSGRAMVYATDTGHGDPTMDAELRRLCQGAGMLIYDAMLTDEEFPSRVSWGHSTWRAGTSVADDAGVGRLVLFHHAPFRNDTAMAALEAEARAARAMTVAAREGMRLTVGKGGMRNTGSADRR